MSQTYSDVDSSSDPSGAVAWQESMATWPSVARYKQQTYHLLTEARVVLDIGCGPGVDLVGLGSGRSVGVHRSARMCSAAARHGSIVACADAHALPFGTGTFEGVRADRVFQHLADPGSGLREIVRVLAPFLAGTQVRMRSSASRTSSTPWVKTQSGSGSPESSTPRLR